MTTRRQERLARVVKEAASNAVSHHLNDPRIEGLVSVTRVEVTADLRNADVFFSILGKDAAAENKTFVAIEHARGRIQALVADVVESKFCPVLRFHRDDKFKKTLETMKLIDQAVKEMEKKQTDSDIQKQ